MQIDHDLGLFAAVRVRKRSARHCHQLGAYKIKAEVVQLLLGESLSGEGELKKRHTGSAIVENQRGCYPGRQKPQSRLGHSRHLGVSGIDTRVRLQKDLED